jgi:hypothetical protein
LVEDWISKAWAGCAAVEIGHLQVPPGHIEGIANLSDIPVRREVPLVPALPSDDALIVQTDYCMTKMRVGSRTD